MTSNGEGGRTVWHRQGLGRRVFEWQQTRRGTGDRGRGQRGKWSGQSRKCSARRKKMGKRTSVCLPLNEARRRRIYRQEVDTTSTILGESRKDKRQGWSYGDHIIIYTAKFISEPAMEIPNRVRLARAVDVASQKGTAVAHRDACCNSACKSADGP